MCIIQKKIKVILLINILQGKIDRQCILLANNVDLKFSFFG